MLVFTANECLHAEVDREELELMIPDTVYCIKRRRKKDVFV